MSYRTEDQVRNEAANWIKNINVKLEGESHSKGVTKVLMNPPFERAYGCMTIVKNVLDSVPVGTMCAFIMPDKKLEVDMTDKIYGNKVLINHRLTMIIKLPENIFSGTTTSVFVFEAGKPQNKQNIIGYYIEEDGLETVKNQGRQDVKDRWSTIEEYWINAIHDGNDHMYGTRQIINPAEHLSYQLPEKPYKISEDDFIKTLMDFEMFKRKIDVRDFQNRLIKKVLYNSSITTSEEGIMIEMKGEE